jgi:mono/diheme cytochrome c family protein
VTIDEAALRRGQDRYNNFCSMCHGLTGEGDGMIVRRGFQRPPSLHDPGLQEPQASAAHIFQTITNGLGAMPSYATMIPPEDRWKIVAYLRAMQLSRRVNAGELSADERGRIGAPQQHGGAQPARGGEQH